MNSYHKEQIDALIMVKHHIDKLTASEIQTLDGWLTEYLAFRQEVDAFLELHFSSVCTRKCYQSRLSACCSREGIVTFFADVVVNYLVSKGTGNKDLLAALKKSNEGFKCVYLSAEGCRWHLKPIVCQMYLCNQSKTQVFTDNPELKHQWERLEAKRKRFTWPDRPVLFDKLESFFMDAGCHSPLMYLHNSPGLLRVKQGARKNQNSV